MRHYYLWPGQITYSRRAIHMSFTWRTRHHMRHANKLSRQCKDNTLSMAHMTARVPLHALRHSEDHIRHIGRVCKVYGACAVISLQSNSIQYNRIYRIHSQIEYNHIRWTKLIWLIQDLKTTWRFVRQGAPIEQVETFKVYVSLVLTNQSSVDLFESSFFFPVDNCKGRTGQSRRPGAILVVRNHARRSGWQQISTLGIRH